MIERPTREATKNLEFGISTANILDASTMHFAATWPVEKHVSLADSTGFEGGIELWATRPLPAIQIFTGLLSESAKRGIKSAHQSPRAGNVFRHESPKNALLAIGALPAQQNSLYGLEKLQRLVGDIPMVLYDGIPRSFVNSTHIEQRLVQPEPKIIRNWGVRTPGQFIDKMKELGYTGVCLDTVHLRRSDSETGEASPLATWTDWRGAVDTFLEADVVKEVHDSIGRVDPATLKTVDRQATLAELEDRIRNTDTTEATKMLRYIADSGWKGRVVTEVLPSAIKEIIGDTRKFMPYGTLQSVYQDMRNSYHSIFGV